MADWLSGWNKRIKLTIDSSKVDSDLINFPVAIALSTSAGITSMDVSAVFDDLSSDSNRKKIAVTTSDGTTQCYVEIESWDDANEKACLHVKVPSVASASDTDLYLYFDSSHADNTTYVGDSGSTPAQSVWDSDFVGVWHMAQDPSTSGACILDSTSNANHGTPDGSMASGDLVDGQIGKALDFDGADDYINLGNPSEFAVTDFTLEAVYKCSSTFPISTNIGLVSSYAGGSTYQHYGLRVLTSEYPFFFYDDGAEWDAVTGSTINVGDNNYHHMCGTLSAESTGKIYSDGVLAATDSTSVPASITPTGDLLIGKDGTGSVIDNFLGCVAEVRISIAARSTAWLKATYYGLTDGLITSSSPETPIILEDLRLNLHAAAWSREDLKTYLRAHDGLEFDDIALALKTLGLELEDLKTFLSAYYRSEADVRMFLKTLATFRNDIPLSLKAFGQELENIRLVASTVKNFKDDIRIMLAAVSPTILNDIALFLAATNGTILNDIRLRLNAVKRPPQYKSNIAQRLSSVISEVA